MRKRTWIMSVGVSVVASLGIVSLGQASATATVESQLLNQTEASTRYDEVVRNFNYELPEGIVFPQLETEQTLARSAYERVVYEPGAVDARAYFFWQCSWMNRAVQANTADDEETVALALSNLEQWEETDFFKKYVIEEGGSWIEDVVKPATGGDFSPMEASYAAGCSQSEGVSR